MGLSGSKSRIKPPKPGQRLANTGIEEFDSVFIKCEPLLKQVHEIKVELDLRTTEFIESLGAQSQWEEQHSFEELVRLMLIVFSTMARGDLESLSLTYSEEASPYIDLNSKLLNSSSRKMMKTYRDLIKFIESLGAKLDLLEKQLSELADTAKDFPHKAVDKVNEFCMVDKIAAMRNTNKNCKELEQAPAYLKEMIKISIEIKQDIIKACKRASEDHFFADHLIICGLQARNEGLRHPSDIINRYGASRHTTAVKKSLTN